VTSYNADGTYTETELDGTVTTWSADGTSGTKVYTNDNTE